MKHEARLFKVVEDKRMVYAFLNIEDRPEISFLFLAQPYENHMEIVEHQKAIFQAIERGEVLNEKVYIQDKTYLLEDTLDPVALFAANVFQPTLYQKEFRVYQERVRSFR